MPTYRNGNGFMHIKLGKSKKHPPPAHCRAPYGSNAAPCMAMAGFLCDWKVNEAGDTCDMPLCEEHKGQVATEVNYCPKHLAESKAKGESWISSSA